MPGKATVFWRQLRVEIPELLQQAWPALSGSGLDVRIGIAFFGGLLAVGIWDGLRQFGRLVGNLARGARNLAARRPFNTGMENVGLGSVIDTVKVIAIALAFIAGAAGLVIVATGGAFGWRGCAGALVTRGAPLAAAPAKRRIDGISSSMSSQPWSPPPR